MFRAPQSVTRHLRPFSKGVGVRCGEDRPEELGSGDSNLGVQIYAGPHGLAKTRRLAARMRGLPVAVPPMPVATARMARYLNRMSTLDPRQHHGCAAFLQDLAITETATHQPDTVLKVALEYAPHIDIDRFDRLPDAAADTLKRDFTPGDIAVADAALILDALREEDGVQPVKHVGLATDSDHQARGVVAIYTDELWDTAAAWEAGDPHYGENPALLAQINHELNRFAAAGDHPDGLVVPERDFYVAHAALVGATILNLPPQPNGDPLVIHRIGH